MWKGFAGLSNRAGKMDLEFFKFKKRTIVFYRALHRWYVGAYLMVLNKNLSGGRCLFNFGIGYTFLPANFAKGFVFNFALWHKFTRKTEWEPFGISVQIPLKRGIEVYKK